MVEVRMHERSLLSLTLILTDAAEHSLAVSRRLIKWRIKSVRDKSGFNISFAVKFAAVWATNLPYSMILLANIPKITLLLGSPSHAQNFQLLVEILTNSLFARHNIARARLKRTHSHGMRQTGKHDVVPSASEIYSHIVKDFRRREELEALDVISTILYQKPLAVDNLQCCCVSSHFHYDIPSPPLLLQIEKSWPWQWPRGYRKEDFVARVSRDTIPISLDLTIHSYNPLCLDLTTFSCKRFPYQERDIYLSYSCSILNTLSIKTHMGIIIILEIMYYSKLDCAVWGTNPSNMLAQQEPNGILGHATGAGMALAKIARDGKDRDVDGEYAQGCRKVSLDGAGEAGGGHI
ncbi:uncharacterized protein BDR25DRAFT_357762 [Lindgomyces ingoldianus]|uniref:Uncharacterized protein n=1 Tax=Lindgomyces ingoldianus TaxID=673940 RepID=A0ACB6QNC1_9PLEO|nr:uncharacterized protein BDR25DRAFT_357762 [Lindgomyces ingoldianus]KAF2468406.1 hypothetical protein BDR25DRAFT_357762 [Lindgomyces ingoldianus]